MPGAEYFRWFYDHGIWKNMHYLGVRILNVPSDPWNYQEIFAEECVDWVIETGTRHGGSALFFADLLQLNGAQGRVISVDNYRSANRVGNHPRIDFVMGDSGAPELAGAIGRSLPAALCS